MTKDNFLKFLEELEIPIDDKHDIILRAFHTGWNAALYRVTTHVCIEPLEKLPECCKGKLKGGEDGR